MSSHSTEPTNTHDSGSGEPEGPEAIQSEGSMISVDEGRVALILLHRNNSSFYLDIPIATIDSLCLKPLKYLRFLGWCILGNEGRLSLQHDGNPIGTDDGAVVNQQIYHYIMNEVFDLRYAVNLDVIKTRTGTVSESSISRNAFRAQLLKRDVSCVWTGANVGNGLHIIPYNRGPAWIQTIINNRPNGRPFQEQDLSSFVDINDVRNGIFANQIIHASFDQREIACLKTPNPILQPDDIPPRHNRTMDPRVKYPIGRFTLQWLMPPNEFTLSMVPNNSDATFKKVSRLKNPSDLLLHYTYGAAAVKIWGRGIDVLQNRDDIPRPQPQAVPAAGLSKHIHDRSITTRKFEEGRNRRGAAAGISAAGAGAGGVVDSESQEKWDEDDVMLFLWGNSQAAKERHSKKDAEKLEHIEQWRGGVSQKLT